MSIEDPAWAWDQGNHSWFLIWDWDVFPEEMKTSELRREDDDGSEGKGSLWSVKQKDLKGGDRED